MKIIKQGNPPPPIPDKAETTCIFCKAILEIEGKDINPPINKRDEGFWFTCPCCNMQQGTKLILKGIIYPSIKTFDTNPLSNLNIKTDNNPEIIC